MALKHDDVIPIIAFTSGSLTVATISLEYTGQFTYAILCSFLAGITITLTAVLPDTTYYKGK